MRTSLLFIFAIFLISKGNSQTPGKDTDFSIDGEIIGRDTGFVVLWHEDDLNKFFKDTVPLNKGKFHFSGTVNRACEALLWTDLKLNNRDGPGVIRFLLEPGHMDVTYNGNDPYDLITKGSRLQSEKEQWDKVKMSLLISRRQYYEASASLARHYKRDSTAALHDQLSEVDRKNDSVKARIRLMDVEYIREHPTSFLSGYLLYWHHRRLPVDSVQRYYSSLSGEVRGSTLGHLVLVELYPLTDDKAFRQANPLIDREFDRRLQSLRSVYDLTLKDTSGRSIPLSSFKGRYLVIDFWASWCKPCIENIPALNKLITDYRPYPIQFISISVDEDVKAWKQAIIKEAVTGVQLSDTIGFNSLAAIYCKAYAVPTYIIAGPDGQIIKYDAPQAVEPDLKILLDNLLKR